MSQAPVAPFGKPTDYLLNLLGIRVWKDECQLISWSGEEWVAIGPRHRLPLEMPVDLSQADGLLLTAIQFDYAHPEAGLLDRLCAARGGSSSCVA